MRMQLDNVSKRFGEVAAVSDVSFSVSSGECLGLLGPNGSGKTTVLNIASRIEDVDHGDIRLDGRSLLTVSAQTAARSGIARIFQTVRLSPHLTAAENVSLGLYGKSSFTSIWQSGHQHQDAIRNAMTFCELKCTATSSIAVLSYLAQRKLELARCVLSNPEIILMDEPTSGFTDKEREDFTNMIGKLKAKGIAVLLVEHSVLMMEQVCDRIVVLNLGRKLMEGPTQQVLRDHSVIESYLGSTRAAS